MSTATNATVTTTDPGMNKDGGDVTTSRTKTGTNDTVTVGPWEDGTNTSRNVQVVLQVNAAAGARATVDSRSGSVTLTASGTGTVQYLVITLNSSDPNNWSVTVNTSGGSEYTFTKGSGGGGK